MSKQQKQIAAAGAALLVLVLIYRWRQAQGSGSQQATGVSTPATNASGSASDYAALAGQEQSDVAGLQSQNSQLLGQLTGIGAQEQADIAGVNAANGGLAASIAGLTTQIEGFTNPDAALGAEVAALATGVTQLNRIQQAQTAKVNVAKSSPFARYYHTVTGKTAPATVLANNWIYQAYKNGVKATALEPGHPAGNHAGKKNTHVAHTGHDPKTTSSSTRAANRQDAHTKSVTSHTGTPSTRVSGTNKTGPTRKPTAPRRHR